MWFPFWHSGDRFSLEEFKDLNDQLQELETVNDSNMGFVVEILRSISEFVTYGDRHDPSIFEFFMEKQTMAQFLRILKISENSSVAIQLLQTLNIMIQNLHSEHAIYYLFSNEYINNFIKYPFDFHNEELVAYYISFLRTIAGKLDENTISLLVETQNDAVVSFPLYSEAIKFAHHEENMVRIAVRALTLKIYQVSDESVYKFIVSAQMLGYFADLVKFLRQQCFKLDTLVGGATKLHDSSQITSKLVSAIEEIGDNLYYCNDVICSGVPGLSRLMTQNLLRLLVLPVLLPSLHTSETTGIQITAVTSLYLLSLLLQVVHNKDLVNSIAAAFLYPPMVFTVSSDLECNVHLSVGDLSSGNDETQKPESQCNVIEPLARQFTNIALLDESGKDREQNSRDTLLSFIFSENYKLVLASLSLMVVLLHSKDIDNSLLDALGLLPQRMWHKKLLLQALMGRESDEAHFFPSSDDGVEEEMYSTSKSTCNLYLENIMGQHIPYVPTKEEGMNPRMLTYQILDALMRLLCCRPPPCAEAMRHAGWLLQKLLPYYENKLSRRHFNAFDAAYEQASNDILKEVKDCWCDVVSEVLLDEWRDCKKELETPALQKDLAFVVLPDSLPLPPEDDCSSSFIGERMQSAVKVFVLLHQLRNFIVKGALPENPQLTLMKEPSLNSRARRAGLDIVNVKVGVELNLVPGDAIPCRVAFEEGKEQDFYLLAMAKGMSGWLLLAEEVLVKPHRGVVFAMTPLAGSNPKIDENHPEWLHLRIRLPNFSSIRSETAGISAGRYRTNQLSDGRWTLAFSDQQTCMHAKSTILEEMAIQSSAVEHALAPFLI